MVAINRNDKLYDIIVLYPEVKDIMVGLGFKDIVKPGMLQSMGKIMTIEKGARAKNISWELVFNTFKERGYELI
ncbi:MAG: DUF1858 domain-containing protein [Eubacteriales bacterium]